MLSGWEYIIYAILAFVMSMLSGIVGGGGGFIITPLLILMGLSPAQAVSTGKISGFSIALGSAKGLWKTQKRSWRFIIPFAILALVIGLLAPIVIKNLDSEVYQTVLGVLLIFMAPVLIIKKVGVTKRHPSPLQKGFGWILLSFALSLQAVFSGGLGTLVNVVLMGMMGMTALEANITKRLSQIVLNFVIFLGVVGSGLIVWQVAIIGVVTGLVGSYVGAHIAIKKGEEFASNALIGVIIIAGLALIFN